MKEKVSNSEWDLVISPKSSLFDLNLQELWRYRDLMVLFVKRDFIAQYKQTILGPLWHIIQPILTTLMFLLVFGRIAKISTDGINPILFYLSGITIWSYFSACITNTSNTFVTNASIFGKVYFPRLVLPISVIMSNLVRLLIQFGLLIIMIIYFHFNGTAFNFSINILLVPLIIIIVAGLALGLGLIISALTTKYRDFTVLLGFAVQLGMYITPIAYPLSFIEDKSYKWLIMLNPLSPLIEAFRFALFGKGIFSITSISYSCLFMSICLIIGVLIFNKVEKSFMDTV
ncbi:ABC transporter permease [Flavihumibacter sp.]|uniref:ABC transporter permease n=1 Tax=Flavihumibacter sp. TaxID=1913981 RepID=UPI002FC9A68B